jgi:hypothetical protein
MLDPCVFFDVFIRSGESLFFWSCFDRRWSGPGCRLGSLHAFFFTIQFCSCAARSRSSRSPLLCVAVFFGFHCRPRLPLPIFYFVRLACNWCAPQLVSCAFGLDPPPQARFAVQSHDRILSAVFFLLASTRLRPSLMLQQLVSICVPHSALCSC